MTVQPPNSPKPDSPTLKWKCTGVTNNPHSEVINHQFKCKYCSRTYDDVREENQIAIGQRILISSAGVAAIVAVFLVIGAIWYAARKVSQAHNLVNQIPELQKSLDEAQVTWESIEVELEKTKNDLRQATANWNEAEAKSEALEKLLADTQKDLSAFTARSQRLETRVTNTQAELNSMKQQMEDVTSDITRIDGELPKIKEKLPPEPLW
ncbi:hypothetical protein PJF56_16410 [Roseofilum sp. BLCC_M91]|uniref:Chromosome partition protein Smc n=1 Tax=Roseofilum halophilum BLCC-M91 TaxID=3022259 RepID=A0ABT7BML2_9CYAN|nr:hypothetical protein [Roseofilum halophilum]MDJ1180447.1 hypothetical protein [Roseofilum halophilum BLCC-M91]